MDKNIGRTWKNGNGDERKVVALSSINNVKRYLIGTGRGEASPEADRMPEICSISDIDALIARETKMYEANSEFRKRQEEQRLREAKLEKDRTSLDGFEYTLSNMMRGKAIAALTKSVRHDGRIIPLRDLIRMKVKEGWRVKTSASGARRLEKDGVFLDAKAVTKIGLDYAEHLSNKTDKAEELTMPNTVNNTDVAAIGTMVNDFIAALQLATPGKKVMFPWKGRMTKATSMQVGLLAKRIATAYPEFTAHFNTAKKAIEIYMPAGASLTGIAKALAHPKSVITAGSVKPTVKTFHKILLASGFKITNTESDSSFVPATKAIYTHPDGHKAMVVNYPKPSVTYAIYAHMPVNGNMAITVINTESQLKMAISRIDRAYMRNAPAQINRKLTGKDVNKAALKDLNTHTASNDFTVTAVLNSDDATKMRPTKIDIKAGDKLRYLRGEAHTEFRVNNKLPGYLIGNVMFDRIIKPNLK